MKYSADLKFFKRTYMLLTVVLCVGFIFMVYSIFKVYSNAEHKNTANINCPQSLDLKLEKDSEILGVSYINNKIVLLLKNEEDSQIIFADSCSGEIIRNIKIAN